MTQEEIIEGNRLIAEFLGSKFINDAPEDYPSGYYYQPEEIEDDCPTGIPEDWGFESSWDWLMPVVEKIEKEFTVKIIRYSDELSNICEIETTDNEPLQITYIFGYDYDGKTKINVVYDAVIEFIKWWNASLADR